MHAKVSRMEVSRRKVTKTSVYLFYDNAHTGVMRKDK